MTGGTWNARSYPGEGLKQAFDNGTPLGSVLCYAEKNVATLGLWRLAESGIDYANTGDPTHFQQSSGCFLAGMLALKYPANTPQTRSPYAPVSSAEWNCVLLAKYGPKNVLWKVELRHANSIAVAEETGVAIGRSRFPSREAFRDTVFDRYQQFYDQVDAIAQARVAAGRWPNDPKISAAAWTRSPRARLRSWLASEGMPEGPVQIIQVNRSLRDPAGSGADRILDARVPDANTILDGTIGTKTSTTPQIVNFRSFLSGDNVIIVRPSRIGGSYGIIP